MRRPLSPDRIVAAALRIVDRAGVDALSMRRLGATLHVEAMSLYKHVPDKAALFDSIVARVWTEFTPPPAGASWDARLRHVARELRAIALRHPHLFPLLATRAPGAEASAPLEAMLGALADAGFSDEEMLHEFWAFIAWSTGALLTECAAATGVGAPVLEAPADIDAATFPQLVRLREKLASCDFANEYERGLELVIAAMRGRR